MYRTLEMICRDFARVKGDVWDDRAQIYAGLYSAAFQNYKFTVDTDDDNRASDEGDDQSARTVFTL
jgi:hypothetical protein